LVSVSVSNSNLVFFFFVLSIEHLVMRRFWTATFRRTSWA
jgi:hypothetical protein